MTRISRGDKNIKFLERILRLSISELAAAAIIVRPAYPLAKIMGKPRALTTEALAKLSLFDAANAEKPFELILDPQNNLICLPNNYFFEKNQRTATQTLLAKAPMSRIICSI